MSMLTVADNKGGKKPQYKDYVTFLGTYKNGKKDDQCSVTTNDSGVIFSLNNSSNNSSSSINSDSTDSSKNGFKDYLEHYNHKKYSPVQPSFIKKQDNKQHEEGKIVKTEVYIEINSSPKALNQVSKVIALNNGQNVHNQSSNVSKVSKIFENNTGSSESVVSVSKVVNSTNKVNKFNFEQNGVENQSTMKHEQKKTSIGEISKKFEAICTKSPPVAETHKVPLKKTPSISEKSKIFEENTIADNNQVEIKKQSFNEVSKVFQQNEETTTTRTNGSLSPKPPINPVKPVIVPKTYTESTNTTILSVQQILPKPLQTNSSTFSPPPPPPLQNLINDTPQNIVPSPARQSPTPPQNNIPVPPPPPPQQLSQNSCYIPSPPPPPPVNFVIKKVHNSPPKLANPAQNSTTNGVKGLTLQNKKQDVVDGIPVPVVDRNDPRVKRLVYGALRDMYGAYHDKANDYIATLPKNRVKKNNGLDSIINSIA
ncbi:hypothetical protein NQ314_004942 [Rhamnusium bicolor]|uniref:Uncharacterized protein n=1 Tax=Rhamnusium bicolor TaxID=1586634 RepID=A0AAV8ZIP8_9CUCU|nr:hypothetical protein NQ314_004942 [Rhamnusium bicolor]